MPLIHPEFPFRFYTAPFDGEGLVVAKVRVREFLSRPYVVDVLALAPGTVAASDLPSIGQPASLAMFRDPDDEVPPRMFHGILSRVRHHGAALEHAGTWLRIRLVPRLALLDFRKTRRVFQDRSVLDITTTLLNEHDVQWESRLGEAYPPINYCVQYDERDFEFFQRTLSRFGIFYYFSQTQAATAGAELRECLVLCDHPRQYASVAVPGNDQPRVLKLVEREGTFQPVESILSFNYERRMAQKTVRSRDWDYRVPQVLVDYAHTTDDDPRLSGTELIADEFELLGRGDSIRADRRAARVSLEQMRARAVTAMGTSDCQEFSPGRRFVLNNHDVAHFNIPWVLTAVQHDGVVPRLLERLKVGWDAAPQRDTRPARSRTVE